MCDGRDTIITRRSSLASRVSVHSDGSSSNSSSRRGRTVDSRCLSVPPPCVHKCRKDKGDRSERSISECVHVCTCLSVCAGEKTTAATAAAVASAAAVVARRKREIDEGCLPVSGEERAKKQGNRRENAVVDDSCPHPLAPCQSASHLEARDGMTHLGTTTAKTGARDAGGWQERATERRGTRAADREREEPGCRGHT